MKSKEGPICAARKINIKALCMFRFPAKKAIKKCSERIGPRYPEAARGSGSLGRAVQRGIETAQEEYHEIQETKNRYVLLKHPVV